MRFSIWPNDLRMFASKNKVKKSRGKLLLLLERLDERCLPAVYNPVAVTGFDPPAVEGEPLSTNAILGTFLGNDPVGDFAGTVAFNSGSMLAVPTIRGIGSEFVPGLGAVPEYALQAPNFTPTISGLGALNFQLTIFDEGDNTQATVFGSADVAPAPVVLNAALTTPEPTTGKPLVNFAFGAFAASTLATPADFQGTIDWGDGSPLSAASFASNGAGQFILKGSHTYLASGTLAGGISITVQQLDGANGFTAQTGPVTIVDPIIFDPSPAVAAIVGKALTNVQIAQFTSPNAASVPGDFQATVTNWGDGSSDSTTTIVETSVDGAGAHFAVQASHTYLAAMPAGSNITVQVLESASSPLALSTTSPVSVAPVQPLSGLESFVNALYQQELGRSGAIAELDSWLSLLHQPGGQAAVASGIAGSTEARDVLVKSWYVTYLGRPASGNEEHVWVNDLITGQTEEQTLSQILGTSEYLSHAQTLIATGTSQERLVQSLYKLLLNRNAGASDVADWVNLLPQIGQQALAADFLAGAEYRSDLVKDYYTALLRRSPEQAAIDFWVTSNLPSTKIRAGIESSDEFFFDVLS
jgi:Domain of unknown function (DUF4214)